MPVAVQRDRVPARGDLARQRRIASDLLADEEERRSELLARERVEHRGRAERVRSVVEGECEAAPARVRSSMPRAAAAAATLR